MKPARFDFDIYQGRTLRKRWHYRNPRLADGTPGAGIDITGWHARLIVPNPDAAIDLLTLTDDGPDTKRVIFTEPAIGKFEWYVSDEETALLTGWTKTDYQFDLEDLNGDWIPYLRGVVRLWKSK